jgi:hypothetical protein
MTVTFLKKPKGGKPKKVDTAFERWYQTHKSTFNSSRWYRYHEDAEYRARVLATSQRSRSNRRKPTVAVKPEIYSINLAQAADLLSVTVGTIRNWRLNHYCPEPLRFGGEVWFKPHQVLLLDNIKDFFASKNIRRISAVQKMELDGIVQIVHANWG